MAPLSWARLALVGAVVGALVWVMTRALVGRGSSPVDVPWTVLAVSLAGAVLAIGMGWSVRQYRKGRNPGLSPLRAARTAVYAQACGYAGALLAGGYAGYGLAIALEWSHGPRRAVAVSALVAALGGLALVVAGLVAEHWCRADDDEDGGKGRKDAAPA